MRTLQYFYNQTKMWQLMVIWLGGFFDVQSEDQLLHFGSNHSMARANLKKSKYFSTSTTTASKYIPKRPSFQTQIYLANVPLNVNVVKQDVIKKTVMSERRDFNWCRFWASWVIVLWCCGSRSWEVFTFFQIGSGHTVLLLATLRFILK